MTIIIMMLIWRVYPQNLSIIYYISCTKWAASIYFGTWTTNLKLWAAFTISFQNLVMIVIHISPLLTSELQEITWNLGLERRVGNGWGVTFF